MSKTRNLPFNWDDHFIPSKTDCILACFAMCGRYWGSKYPELGLTTEIEEWKEYANKSFIEYRGTHAKEMFRKFPKIIRNEECQQNNNEKKQDEKINFCEFSDLEFRINTPSDLQSLAPFFETGPPIPQILIFNKLLMTHNIDGPSHAVLVYSIDYDKEKLFVIDSTKHLLKEPDIYDFKRFEKAWRDVQNLQIITYPKEMATLISGPTVGITKQLDLSQF